MEPKAFEEVRQSSCIACAGNGGEGASQETAQVDIEGQDALPGTIELEDSKADQVRLDNLPNARRPLLKVAVNLLQVRRANSERCRLSLEHERVSDGVSRGEVGLAGR